MFKKWFLNLFSKNKDPVLSYLESSKVFAKADKSISNRYKKSYSGFKRIACLHTLVGCSKYNLKLILRVYKSPGEPYLYIFIWSFGDDHLEDRLFSKTHITPNPFGLDRLKMSLKLLTETANATNIIHSVKRKTSTSTSE